MNLHNLKLGFDNCYLIREEGIILVDAGMPDEFEKFTKGLIKLCVSPEEIGLIVITHCHWDHIGCARRIKEFTGAKLAVHLLEKSIIENGTPLMPPGVTRWGKIFGALLKKWSQKFTIEPAEVDIEIGDEGLDLSGYGIKGRILYTPGHSSGSVSVLLDSGKAFVGDMAMNGLPLTLRPGLPIFAEDLGLLKKSWKYLIDKGAAEIYPAHGKHFPIGKIAGAMHS